MFGNGRIFISHTHEDNDVCETLIAALDAWGANFWFDKERLAAGQELFDRIQNALSERDIFVRVCTPAAMRSFWMAQEQKLARDLRAPNRARRRLMINLILKPGYVAQGGEEKDITIDATRVAQVDWLQRLRETLGIPSRERRMSRRALLGVGGVSLVALGAAGYATDLYLTRAAPVFVPTVHQLAPAPPLGASRIRWSYTFPIDSGTLGGTDEITLVNGTLYCATLALDAVVALKASDGARLWQQTFIFAYGNSAPAVGDDTVYFANSIFIPDSATDTGYATQTLLSALRADDGASLWNALIATDLSTETAHIVSTAVVVNKSVFLVSNETVYAFDATTGAPLWKQSAGSPPSDISATLFAPIVTNGIVYVILGDGLLHAFDASDGNPVWAAPFATDNTITTQPVAAGGLVYVADAAGQGTAYALDAATGQLRWKAPLTETPATNASNYNPLVVSGLAVSDGALYVSLGYGLGDAQDYQTTISQAIVVALDAATGKTLWNIVPAGSLKLPASLYSDAMLGSPLVVGASVFALTRFHQQNGINSNMLFALEKATGALQWAVEVPGQVTDVVSDNLAGGAPSTPIASNDTLYFSSSANTLYAIALDS